MDMNTSRLKTLDRASIRGLNSLKPLSVLVFMYYHAGDTESKQQGDMLWNPLSHL